MTVQITHQGKRETHEKGNHVYVAEGHLTVTDNASNAAEVVAVYAPGRWDKALVNPPAAAAG